MPYFPPSSSGGAAILDDLSDVTISSPSTGQVVKYNGSQWVNDTDATGGGGSATIYAATISGVPYESTLYETTISNVSITATSKILFGTGASSDLDENSNEMDTLIVSYIPSTGSMLVRLSVANITERLGGTYKLIYTIG